MAQYLKDEVRNSIHEAALRVFARDGYQAARMTDVADEAGISAGNIYRYFKNKDDLFYTVVDEKFAALFLRLLRRRVRTLKSASDIMASVGTAEELLTFWIEHRLKVVIILARAEGSSYADYSQRVVHELSRLAMSHFAGTEQKSALEPAEQFVLDLLFKNTVTTVVAILSQFEDEASIRKAFHAFWRFQLPGLRGLFGASERAGKVRSVA